ncbi:MAG TPA: hypothetical protein VN637_15980 [Roseiarcus sp.]|nr:hypothetical protein [Roseiarcus sp.]
MFDACVRQRRQAAGIFGGVADVRQQRRSAWLCYTPDLLQRAGAAVLIDDVMNCKTARDDIKTSILKRQFPHIARMQFDTFPNAFQRGVAQRRAFAVPRLIDCRPHINSDGAAAGQPLGREQQHRAAPAADVKERFIAAQAQAVEQFRPNGEFALPGGEQKARSRQSEYKSDDEAQRRHPSPAHRAASPGRHETKQGRDAESDGDIRRIKSVICARHRHASLRGE